MAAAADGRVVSPIPMEEAIFATPAIILNPAFEPVEIAWDARGYWASQLLRTSPNG